MKKIAILSFALVLSACTSTSDVQVSSDTYQETYKDGQTVSTSGTNPSDSFNETDVTSTSPATASTSTATASTNASETSSSSSSIEAASYTLQLVAGQSPQVVTKTASQLSSSTSKWQYTKAINGITIYSLLYGQYATAEAARAAVATLPANLQNL
ncbi:MAG: SPOR domain-containing protein, partial [Vibrio sp.]